MIKIFDMFCSNGSTWIDKEFFNSVNVIKNDIREGEFNINNKQIIKIKPDTKINMFVFGDLQFKHYDRYDLVYMDPPFLKYGSTGLMINKYTCLPEDWKFSLDNMFGNAKNLAPIAILKWNDKHIALNDVLDLAKPYFYLGFGNKRKSKNTDNNTYFIVLIRKDINEKC